ncbi:MAG TPA: dihydroneopterin aldolase [Acidimicrobiales bacterium]|nr:dihydroneopterin aldolase [Acidimicrobiales bacterium]
MTGVGTHHLEVRGLRVVAVHGVLPEERERPQPFELDLDVAVALGPGLTDDLARTVDYGALVERASAVVTGRSYQLLETLADAVAAELLGADDRVVEVEVVVRKLRPPVPAELASVGVAVVRRRADR